MWTKITMFKKISTCEPIFVFQSLYDVRATVPVQLTAKNGASLSIVRSTFATLPWPGIYVYNVTRKEPRISKSFIRLGCNQSF